MGKVFKYLFGIAAAIIAISAVIFLVFTYWEKILAYMTAGARVASNILGQITGDTADKEGSTGDYDI